MLIGIDASRAARPDRTGVEEYTYQLVREIAGLDKINKYRLYTDRDLPESLEKILPSNFEVRVLPFFRLWTQIRLAWELFFHPPDILWVPASAMPWLHPSRTIVTIHGLEFEYFPRAYSLWSRWYLRFSTKMAVRKAWRVVSVSANTKQDLVKKYQADPRKIVVIPNGYTRLDKEKISLRPLEKYNLKPENYFIYYGRLEKRKNLARLIKAFNIFRDRCQSDYKLVLAGKPGYGYDELKSIRDNSPFGKDILFTGYLSRQDLVSLLAKARALIYPSLYEGFGLPVLEALSLDVDVACSKTSSLPEVGGEAVVYFDPCKTEDMSKSLLSFSENKYKVSSDIVWRHLAKFSWRKNAQKLVNIWAKG